VPIHPRHCRLALQDPTGIITPTLDGVAGYQEWAAGRQVEARGGRPGPHRRRGSPNFTTATIGRPSSAVDAKQEWAALGDAVIAMYIGVPGRQLTGRTSRFAPARQPTPSLSTPPTSPRL